MKHCQSDSSTNLKFKKHSSLHLHGDYEMYFCTNKIFPPQKKIGSVLITIFFLTSTPPQSLAPPLFEK